MRKGKYITFCGILIGMLLIFAHTDLEIVWAAEENVIVCEANGQDNADDTGMIQQALDAAQGSEKVVTVKIPSGKFYISRPLVIYSNTTLHLENDTEIIRTDEQHMMIRSEQNYDIGGYDQVHDITIEGGTWNGNVKDSTILCPLMYYCHGRNITLRDFSVKSVCSRHMVIVAGVDTANISNLKFSDFVLFTGEDVNKEYYNSVNETGEIDVELSMRTMEALHLDAISADGLSEAQAYPCDNTVNQNITVENCTFTGGMSGVGSHYMENEKLKGIGLTIRNNKFQNVKYTGINVYNQENTLVENNIAEASGELIRVVNSSGNIQGNSAKIREDANESSLDLCGIKVTKAENLRIAGNTLNGGKHSIWLSNVKGIVEKNQIKNAQVNGLSILDNSDVSIISNTISNSKENAIYIEKTTTVAKENVLSQNAGNGIALYDTSKAELEKNQIEAAKNGVLLNNTVGNVQQNTINGSKENGVWILNKSNITVSGNQITGSGINGIRVEEAQTSCLDNTIQNNVQGAIYIYKADGAQIIRNVLTEGEGNSISSYSSNGVKIQDNQVTSPVNGILLNAGNAEVIGNNISGAKENGIWILNKAVGTLTGNKIATVKKNGIRIEEAEGVVAENTIKSAEKEGIYTYKSSKAQVKKNVLSEILGNGIASYQSENIEIEDNVIENAETAILINNTKGNVKNNKIQLPRAKGIYVYSSANSKQKNAIISGNTVVSAKDRGIQIEDSSYILVQKNTVEKCEQQGIRVLLSSNCIDIKENVVKNNKQHGILIDKSTNIEVISNIATDNKTKDISVINESTGKAQHNVISNVGIYTYDKKKFPVSSDTGMIKVSGEWIYLKEGVWDKNYTGMAKNDYGWWYMTKGKLDTKYTGMAKNDYGWWYMTKGKLDTKYTGMAKNDYGWWYITKGKLDTKYTGIGENAYGKWYMKDGKLQSGFTGNITINGKTYKISKGKVVG